MLLRPFGAKFLINSGEYIKLYKRDLPEKNCAVCNLPFKWRKKWRNNWENVVYCSERCRKKKHSLT